jgi:hypothetical protein
VAPRTRQGYCFWVSRFLARFSAPAAPDWSSLRGEDLTTFVQQEASRLHRHSRALPGTAIRAFLRYLTFLGVIRSGLEAAVPRMPDGSTPSFRRICLPPTWNVWLAALWMELPKGYAITRFSCCSCAPACAPTK